MTELAATDGQDGGRPEVVAGFDIFLSHNSRDKAPVERIAERLKRAGIEPWLDKWSLTPGGDWQRELGDGLEASRACAVFIGPHQAGAWEIQEAGLAVDRAAKDHGFRVFPVLLPGVPEPFDPNLLPHFLRSRTWVDFRSGHENGRALQDLIHATKGIPFGPDVPIEPRDDVCPYRGLRAFEPDDAEFFFGRDRDVQRLTEKLKAGRFLAVLGPSGSGKSSLVRAGLLPALTGGALPDVDEWHVCVIRPGATPLTALAAGLHTLSGGGAMQETVDGLARDERTLHLAVSLVLAGRPAGERVLLVLDQFEEVFTMCRDEQERRALFANLLHAASVPGGGAVVVLTMRADFYPKCAAYAELSQLLTAHQFLVGPMDADGLRQAIEEPARRVGLQFEEGLTATILDDVGKEPGALPLLEHALLELWERRRGSMLTLEGYRDAGGVDGALAKRADEIFSELSGDEQEIARRTLLRLTEPGEGTEDTRRRAALSELATGGHGDEFDAVLGRLVAARMLTSGSDDAGHEQFVEVSHEALIRGWPRLRGWIDADRAALRVQRRLTDAAREWDDLGREDGALYRGARLAEAVEFAGGHEAELTTRERAFVDAGVEHEQRERAAEEERRRKELEDARALAEAQGRAKRRLMVAAAVLLLGVVGAGAAALVALDQKKTATQQSSLALSRQLAANAGQQLPQDPELALLLALESARRSHTVEAEDALRATLQSPLRETLRGHNGTVVSAAFDGDGRRALTAGTDGTARVWDVATGRTIAVLRHGARVLDAAFDAGGTRVLTAGADGVAASWDVRTGRRLSETAIRRAGTVLRDAAFSPDGRRVATAGSGGVAVWTLGTTGEPRRLTAQDAFRVAFAGRADRLIALSRPNFFPLNSFPWAWDLRSGRRTDGPAVFDPVDASLSADGKTALLVGGDGVFQWPTRGTRWKRVAGAGVTQARFSNSGGEILTVGAGGGDLWDVATRRRLAELRAGARSMTAAGFSGDGRRVVTGDEGGTARIWEPGVVGLTTDAEVAAVAGSADGRRVGSLVAYGSAAVWDAASGRLQSSKPARIATTSTLDELADLNRWAQVSFSRDGRLVFGAADGSFDVFDAATGRRLTETEADAASADGSRIARFTGHGTSADVLDAESPRRVARLPLTLRRADALVLSPDGRQLAAFRHGGDAVEVLDVKGDAHGTVLRQPGDRLDGARISPDGRRLVTALLDGTLRTWDLASRKPLATLSGHVRRLWSAAFSTDGRLVVSGGSDGTTRVWETDTGRSIAVLPGGGAAAFASGKRSVAIVAGLVPGNGDVSAIRDCAACATWPVLLRRAEARAHRTLTAAERQRFIGG